MLKCGHQATTCRRAAMAGSALALILGLPAQAQTAGEPTVLDEVIVTATKRPERVRDISGSVTAFSGERLETLGAQGLEDYITRTPGVVFNASTPGNSTVVIRGVSTSVGIDQGQGTTGYFINDVPLTDPSYSIGTPDIDTFDVENVAILRGPQGTLFGSSSLGGAINYQAARPDASGFDVRAQATIDSTRSGDVGGSGKLMVNVPLGDTVAVRAVYYDRETAGYIDNVGTGRDDANVTTVRGGRFQALWEPRDGTSLSYLYLQQSQDTADNGYQEPATAGDKKKDSLIPEFSNFDTLIHNLRLDHELPFGTLTATATYHRKEQDGIGDLTEDFGPLLPGSSPITLAQIAESEGQTYEIRLASNPGRFEYLIGVMHDETDQDIANILVGDDAEAIVEAVYGPLFGPGIGALAAPGGVLLDAMITARSRESAIFGEATYHFTDTWKATAGGRAFKQEIDSRTVSQGFYTILVNGTLTSDESGSQEADGFNPKASLTWTPNSNFMAYGLVSKGFRFGGPNIILSTPDDPVPAFYESDSLVNYEIGLRSTLLDGRLLIDATAFYIDWSDIQLRLQTSTQLNYAANAGTAEIKGLETSVTFRPTDGLTLSSSITWLDAELAEPFDNGGGDIVPAGSTLPGASEWQISNVAQYEWDAVRFEPSLTLSHRYLSDAPGGLITGDPQGDYHIVDARLRVNLGQVGLTAFVNNIGDTDGVTNASFGQEYIVRPRTIGLTLDYRL